MKANAYIAWARWLWPVSALLLALTSVGQANVHLACSAALQITASATELVLPLEPGEYPALLRPIPHLSTTERLQLAVVTHDRGEAAPGSVLLFSTTPEDEVSRIEFPSAGRPGYLSQLELSPSGQWGIAVRHGSGALLFDVERAHASKLFPAVKTVAFSPQGTHLLVVGTQKTQVLSLATLQPVFSVTLGETDPVIETNWISQQAIVMVHGSGLVSFWDVLSGQSLGYQRTGEAIATARSQVKVSQDGQLLAFNVLRGTLNASLVHAIRWNGTSYDTEFLASAVDGHGDPGGGYPPVALSTSGYFLTGGSLGEVGLHFRGTLAELFLPPGATTMADDLFLSPKADRALLLRGRDAIAWATDGRPSDSVWLSIPNPYSFLGAELVDIAGESMAVLQTGRAIGTARRYWLVPAGFK